MTLTEKIEVNKRQLEILEQKKMNLERNIDNLKRKIENQEFALKHSPEKQSANVSSEK